MDGLAELCLSMPEVTPRGFIPVPMVLTRSNTWWEKTAVGPWGFKLLTPCQVFWDSLMEEEDK